MGGKHLVSKLFIRCFLDCIPCDLATKQETCIRLDFQSHVCILDQAIVLGRALGLQSQILVNSNDYVQEGYLRPGPHALGQASMTQVEDG